MAERELACFVEFAVADAEIPPNAAVMTLNVVALTTGVWTLNGALSAPAATRTLAFTVAGPLLDNNTSAPPDCAAAVSVTVPVRVPPPTVVDLLNESDASAGRANTVSVDDCWLPAYGPGRFRSL